MSQSVPGTASDTLSIDPIIKKVTYKIFIVLFLVSH